MWEDRCFRLKNERNYVTLARLASWETRLTLYTWFNFQILNIAAVSIVEAFANQSKGDDKAQEKTIYLVVIV